MRAVTSGRDGNCPGSPKLNKRRLALCRVQESARALNNLRLAEPKSLPAHFLLC